MEVKFSFLISQFVEKRWKVLANLLSSSGGLQSLQLPMYHTISLSKWSNYPYRIREMMAVYQNNNYTFDKNVVKKHKYGNIL